MIKLNAVIDETGDLIWLDQDEPPGWFLGNKQAYTRYSVRISKMAAEHANKLFMTMSRRPEAWQWLKTTAQSMEAV